MTWPTRCRSRLAEAGADDRGSLTVMSVILLVPLVAYAGLAFDGGQALAARREANDVAFAAARAGAQAAQGQALTGVAPDIDTAAAIDTATNTAAAAGWPGATVTVNGSSVTVSVTGTVDYALLPLIGVNGGTVTATATAIATWGVTDAGT